MKEYNRKTKQWEEKKTEKVSSLKRPAHCKGGKPHDPILVLPDRVNFEGEPSPEKTEKYYHLMEVRKTLEEQIDSEVKEMGILENYWRSIHRVTRYYQCSQCGKKTYEQEKK